MNYIWDIALRARQSGIARKDLFFRQAESCSPWYEQAFPVLNQTTIEDTTIELNGRYRFDAIFNHLLDPDKMVVPIFRQYLYDLAMHLLCEFDLHQGLTKQEFYIRRLSHEISSGVLGAELAEQYESFSAEQKNQLASLLLSQMKTGTSLFLFRQAVVAVFPEAMLYQMRGEPEQLLLYIGKKKTQQYEQGTQFLLHTFMPLNHRIRLFWAHHFGVLGVDATMQLEEIEIL